MLNVRRTTQLTVTMLALAVGLATGHVAYAEGKRSADEIAKELSNPAGSLASLNFNLQYTTFKGDSPGADSQDASSMIFQPVLPFPVGDKGRNVIFRPAVPLLFNQPVVDATTGRFESADVNLGDIGFDLVYSGNEVTDKAQKKGYLWGFGGAGTLPTATNDDVGGDQWRVGPEVFGGLTRKWGVVGALVNHQWDVGGSNKANFSTTSAQYFYAYSLGQGWQIASGPTVSYDWEAASGSRWTIPLGIGIANTTKIGSTPWKFALQAQYHVAQADRFGPEWLLKFTMTPVVKNRLAGLFK